MRSLREGRLERCSHGLLEAKCHDFTPVPAVAAGTVNVQRMGDRHSWGGLRRALGSFLYPGSLATCVRWILRVFDVYLLTDKSFPSNRSSDL
jgi:hypothetical protein